MTDIYLDGALRERWDDETRVFTEWDDTGQQISTRPYTEAENAAADARVQAETERSNERTIRDQALTALQNNRDFLDITAPTNQQVLAQVKALTRQNNGIIRIALQRFDGTA